MDTFASKAPQDIRAYTSLSEYLNDRTFQHYVLSTFIETESAYIPPAVIARAREALAEAKASR